jgi:hypothetical protein
VTTNHPVQPQLPQLATCARLRRGGPGGVEDAALAVFAYPGQGVIAVLALTGVLARLEIERHEHAQLVAREGAANSSISSVTLKRLAQDALSPDAGGPRRGR